MTAVDWIPLVAAFLVSWLLLFLLLQRGRLPMDHPNARSLHVSPKPRIGGNGIMAGLVVASAFLADGSLLPVLGAAFVLAMVSFLDDVRGLHVVYRFLAHFIVALACLLVTGVTGWALLLGVLVLVWMTNLYNFMDGSDGLAGGMAFIGFAVYACLAWFGDQASLAFFCLSISAASLGFLLFNFPPARLFMGDVGSVPLGFLAGAIGLLGWRENLWHPALPLLVFSPFIVDATVTLLRRAFSGENIWQAHRSHYYQRLVLMGWSHRRLALSEYVLMIAVGVSGIFLLRQPDWQVLVLVAWVAIYCVMAVLIDRRWKEFSRAN